MDPIGASTSVAYPLFFLAILVVVFLLALLMAQMLRQQIATRSIRQTIRTRHEISVSTCFVRGEMT
jgi:hypothetical protein